MNKFSQLLCIAAALSLSSCQNKKDLNQWDNACLDPGLPKNIIYHEMDKQDEVYSFSEKPDGSKRSSDVAYFNGDGYNKRDSAYAKLNNCRAWYYSNSDTLLIGIGLSSGFGGQGLTIRYRNKRFSAKAYTFTDVIVLGEPKPVQKVIYQKLSLNKLNYSVGDSIFGRIEFKSVEINSGGDTVLHVGKGNFRSKVKQIIINK